MNEISASLKNIFCSQKPPILKLEVGFFSDRKIFSQIFENWIYFFHLKFNSIKKKKNQRTFLDRSGGRDITRVYASTTFPNSDEQESTLSLRSLTPTPETWRPRPKAVEMSSLPPSLPKNVLWFFFIFYRNKLQVKKKYPIFENLRKTFLIGKKSDFKFQNRGFLWAKNVL